ncbi:MAG TPA: hypothetical protein VIO83_10645 [Pseudomonas sp.]
MRESTTALSRDADWLWSSEGISFRQALEETQKLSACLISRSRVSGESYRYRIAWQHYGMGALELNFMSGATQRVMRTRSMIDHDRNNDFHLVLMQAGGARMIHDGSDCELAPGAMILLNCAKSWDLMFPSSRLCLSARMDFRWLRRWLPDPSALAGRVVGAGDPWGAPMVEMMKAIAAEGIENAPMPHALLADQMAGLLVLALAPREDVQARHGAELLRRIRAVIRD